MFTRRTQAALAARLGVSQPQISLLLSMRRPWQIKDLDKIADFFCVTVADLFHEGHGGFNRRSGVDRRSGRERRRSRQSPAPDDPEQTPPKAA